MHRLNPLSKTLPGVLASLVILSGCSLEIIPVHHAYVNSAKMAEQPLLRGPDAPGAFKFTWTFERPKGFRWDPEEVEIVNGVARLKGGVVADRERMSHVETSFGSAFAALNSFEEVTGPGHGGRIVYQVSHNSSAWYYYNGKNWVPSGPSYRMANTAKELSEALGRFHTQIGTGSLYLKVFLIAPMGSKSPELKEFAVQGVAPRTDSW